MTSSAEVQDRSGLKWVSACLDLRKRLKVKLILITEKRKSAGCLQEHHAKESIFLTISHKSVILNKKIDKILVFLSRQNIS
jgi:hypothetical protein